MVTLKKFEYKKIKFSITEIMYQYNAEFSMSCEIPHPNNQINDYNVVIKINDNFNLTITIYDVFYDEILYLSSNSIFAEKINKKMLLNIIQEQHSINRMINNIGLNVIEDLLRCLNIFFERINIMKIAGN